MKDFYKRLNVDESAPEQTLRDALHRASARWRQDAEYVLLDPKRRAVYDRNRRLLLTIGELRLHLGLNYTRFWARQEFKDFWQELAPAGPAKAPGRKVDAKMIAGAFRAVGRRGRRHAARVGMGWILATSGVIVLLLGFLWHFAT
ncbi:MAG TPA: hypothetical protein VN541_19240 [Tepidisphaeraceae bacterium]|nr:hypothetical protein [Tepidisphaeraceae bacterium]